MSTGDRENKRGTADRSTIEGAASDSTSLAPGKITRTMPLSMAAQSAAFGQSRARSNRSTVERADPWLMDDASMNAMGLAPAEDGEDSADSIAGEKCRHPVAANRRAFAGATASAGAGAHVSTNAVGEVVDVATYGAAFTAGLLEGSWSAVVDLFQGAADMVELIGKTVYQLVMRNPGAVVAMLMEWVDKLKLAWANRSKIADDFMRKWDSDDDWDRGNFQGEVLGWVMMTALLILATSGAAALAAATGRWASILRLLASINALGDLTTYLAKLGRLPAKVVAALRSRFGNGPADAASETATDAAKVGDSPTESAKDATKTGDGSEENPGERNEAAAPKLTDSSGSAAPKALSAGEWVEQLKLMLTPDELDQYAKMTSKWNGPEEMQQHFGGDLDAARKNIAREVSKKAEAAELRKTSLLRAAQIRELVEEHHLMRHEGVKKVLARLPTNPSKADIASAAVDIRTVIVSELRAKEVAARYPNVKVLREVKIWEEQKQLPLDELDRLPESKKRGLTRRTDADGETRVYKNVTDIDLFLVEDLSGSGKAKILRFEQQKTGANDTPAAAKAQNDISTNKLEEARSGATRIRLELEDKVDMIEKIDLESAAGAAKVTVGPAEKSFDESLGITAPDLERLMKSLVADAQKERAQ
jgi:hypothetical protein